MGKKIVKFIDNAFDNTLMIVLILLLMIGIYISYDTAYVYRSASLDKVARYKPDVIDEVTMKEISENVVAWITIDDTQIDYPIMQGATNNEYLNKDPYGAYSLAGSIFMDSRNKADFSDEYIVIYGHHMTGGYMFGALDEYKKETYFDAHRTGTLYVGDKQYPLSIVAFLIADANDYEIFGVDKVGLDRKGFILDKATILRDDLDGKLMSLTTCINSSTTERTIVVAKILEDQMVESNIDDLIDSKQGGRSDVESTAGSSD